MKEKIKFELFRTQSGTNRRTAPPTNAPSERLFMLPMWQTWLKMQLGVWSVSLHRVQSVKCGHVGSVGSRRVTRGVNSSSSTRSQKGPGWGELWASTSSETILFIQNDAVSSGTVESAMVSFWCTLQPYTSQKTPKNVFQIYFLGVFLQKHDLKKCWN